MGHALIFPLLLYSQMTTTPDFRALLADDAYAASFQSMGQYRTALLKALATPAPEPPTDEAWQEFIEQVQRAQHVAIREGECPRFDLVECALALWRETIPPAPPPEPPTFGGVEDAAKAIYSDAMIWAAANASGGAIPSWVEDGNSTAQDVARRVARSLIAPPPEPPTDTELDALEEKLWHEYKTCGYPGEEFMYDYSFKWALSDYRTVLEGWGK